ncbi:sugar ABC transporter ATP-binding protein [Ktedonosporobacter rubrisoli]|uniref:Sugar ABC transporter ATP-binding protein n=2 Tax=Ktedonosporobacter rubrisoli TaxID=2509675 RepID=A0A4P6K515_KTERU|nr:sugar ABC transporter ATP-binding protein [Ktedonosporobacter rubrisoli]
MLEAEGIYKSYGGISALKGVDFRVRAGSVHALVGENGAGKSTLVKILAGATSPDMGTLCLEGQPVHFASTAEAARRGIAVVSQELNLFPDLDVLANLFPMRELRRGPFVARKQMIAQARPILHELGLDLDLRALVETLSLEQRQLLEIARALMVHPRVLILDEPTSALHARQTELLHGVLRTLRQRKVAVVYVSHVLEDVLSLCDEVTVLRDGERVLDAIPVAQLKIEEIVAAMLGDKAASTTSYLASSARKAMPESRALRFEHVSIPGRLQEVTLEAPAGAIIGVAGLSGSGHRDVLAVTAGLLRPVSGHVWHPSGVEVRPNQREAVKQGIALVPGDRQRIGLMLDKSVWDNVAQVRAVALRRAGWLLRADQLRARAREHVARLGISTPSVDQEVRFLSGGNQQKVVFAKWLEADPSVLLLDDPTRGIDVGAKAEIYALMHGLAQRGVVQVLASTDPQELATVCDRVFVFYSGRICATLEPPRLDAHTILEVMNTGEPP